MYIGSTVEDQGGTSRMARTGKRRVRLNKYDRPYKAFNPLRKWTGRAAQRAAKREAMK
jgi:hypothetical protein